MFQRILKKHIIQRLFKGKIIILYGPRQVGKTTLVKEIMEEYEHSVYVTCDDPVVVAALTNKSAPVLRSFFGKATCIVIDEAQRVQNIGISLKLLIDHYPELQIIATGSSSFELSQKINEPLTGRKYEFMLYPLSLQELSNAFSYPALYSQMTTRVIQGMYPAIVNSGDSLDLKMLTTSYLFKDILEHQQLRHPQLLVSLLQALALQIGSEVSYTELAQLLGVEKNTIIRYIDLLEKSFIIFSIPSFARNLRNELKKSKKIYFYDTGLRNALINNLNDAPMRNDMGGLWENFVFVELMKYHHNNLQTANYYFWRTHQQQEIDIIIDQGGNLQCYECKRGKKGSSLPKVFQEHYPQAKYSVITAENILHFVA